MVMDGSVEPLPSEAVPLERTVDRYVLMTRYGDDYWTAMQAGETMSDMRALIASLGVGVTAYRVIRVRGLPVEVPNSEEV